MHVLVIIISARFLTVGVNFELCHANEKYKLRLKLLSLFFYVLMIIYGRKKSIYLKTRGFV